MGTSNNPRIPSFRRKPDKIVKNDFEQLKLARQGARQGWRAYSIFSFATAGWIPAYAGMTMRNAVFRDLHMAFSAVFPASAALRAWVVASVPPALGVCA